MSFVFGQPEETSCAGCNRLRKATDGKVQYCLRHDPKISEADRKKYGVAYEQLPALREKVKQSMERHSHENE